MPVHRSTTHRFALLCSTALIVLVGSCKRDDPSQAEGTDPGNSGKVERSGARAEGSGRSRPTYRVLPDPVAMEPEEARTRLKALGVQIKHGRGRSRYELTLNRIPVSEDGEPMFANGDDYLMAVAEAAVSLDLPVTKLSLNGTSVDFEDLTALQWLSDLDSIELLNSDLIRNLAPVAGLEKLRTLSLRDCEALSDLAPLAEHPALRKLDLHRTAVSDLSPLASSPELNIMSIVRSEGIKDLSPLADHPKLRVVTIAMSEPDPASLAKLFQLDSLTLLDVPLQSAAFLRDMREIRTLNLRRTGIGSLVPLANLRRLRQLSIEGAEASHFEALANLRNLDVLTLSGTAITSEEVEDLRERLPETRFQVSRSGDPPGVPPLPLPLQD